MSSLSDKKIIEMVETKQMIIEPLIKDNVQPGSIDLTLGRYVEVIDSGDEIIDVSGDVKDLLQKHTKQIDVSEGYVLSPGEFVVGHSEEHIELPHTLNGIITNRNSMANIGLNVSLTQFINPGFSGNKLIAIQNIGKNKIRIKRGMRICQLILFMLDAESQRTYDSRHETTDHLDRSIADFMNERIAIRARGE